MNKKILSAVLITTAILAFAGKKNDPVLMTVDGNKITLSEFEYLYNKNNSQQIEPLTLDQYVDMFVNYKLKVADAIDEGLDTTQSFRSEYGKFRNELAAPYLRDEEAADELVKKAYSHLGEDVYVSHIMLKPNADGERNDLKLDSIRNLIVSGQMTFEDAARRFSIDKPSATRGGRMGWVTGNSRLPWEFEDMSYQTAVGEISPVVNSGFGFHIIRPEERRNSRGEVKAQHILVLTQGLDSAQIAAKKEKIDSIYNVATPQNFSKLAETYSEDPGSARRGGDLGWFGAGRMVPEFEDVAFTIADGEISKPFATSYGFHIILRNEHRGDTVPSLDQVREKIEKSIENDSRNQIPARAWLEKTAAATNSKINANLPAQIQQALAAKEITSVDSAAIEMLKANNFDAYVVNGNATSLASVLDGQNVRLGMDAASTAQMIEAMVKADFDKALQEYGRQQLLLTNPDYRNLINEYRDGILLFEVANQKVWNKASKDKEGLEKYFQANRDKYVWDQPRFKSYVIFATSDSVLNEAREFVNSLDKANINQEDLTAELRKKFLREVKLEKVIAMKGENPITDYLGFGGEKPDNLNQRWAGYFAFMPQVIDQPQEATDLKGLVVTDYQNYLEQQWVEDLHKRHKVKVNKKVLNKAK